MTSYTNEQIRGAILKAAAYIDANPTSLDHGMSCDFNGTSAGCMLVHVGRKLGMHAGLNAVEVAEACGISQGPPVHEWQRFNCNENHLFSFLDDRFGREEGCAFGVWQKDARLTAEGLRAYADAFYSAPVASDRQLVSWSQCAWRPRAMA